jgi:hypothetical protein
MPEMPVIVDVVACELPELIPTEPHATPPVVVLPDSDFHVDAYCVDIHPTINVTSSGTAKPFVGGTAKFKLADGVEDCTVGQYELELDITTECPVGGSVSLDGICGDLRFENCQLVGELKVVPIKIIQETCDGSRTVTPTGDACSGLVYRIPAPKAKKIAIKPGPYISVTESDTDCSYSCTIGVKGGSGSLPGGGGGQSGNPTTGGGSGNVGKQWVEVGENEWVRIDVKPIGDGKMVVGGSGYFPAVYPCECFECENHDSFFGEDTSCDKLLDYWNGQVMGACGCPDAHQISYSPYNYGNSWYNNMWYDEYGRECVVSGSFLNYPKQRECVVSGSFLNCPKQEKPPGGSGPGTEPPGGGKEPGSGDGPGSGTEPPGPGTVIIPAPDSGGGGSGRTPRPGKKREPGTGRTSPTPSYPTPGGPGVTPLDPISYPDPANPCPCSGGNKFGDGGHNDIGEENKGELGRHTSPNFIGSPDEITPTPGTGTYTYTCADCTCSDRYNWWCFGCEFGERSCDTVYAWGDIIDDGGEGSGSGGGGAELNPCDC